MRVTDSARAASAGQLFFIAFVANLGMTLLFYVVNWVVPRAFDGPWPLIQEVLWIGVSGIVVVSLFQLSQALDDKGFPIVVAVGWVFSILVDLLATLAMRGLRGGESLIPSAVSTLLFDVSSLVTLLARAALFVFVVRLTMETRAWVMPVLGVSFLLTLGRTALSFAMSHNLGGRELVTSPAYGFVSLGTGFFNSIAILAAAWAVRETVRAAPGSSGVPVTAQAGLVPSAPEPISPAADFLIGGILLAVGIGVTVVTMSAASSGGRYVVATGAIGVGIGRIIRGVIRSSKS
jgi:hypothetical protein